MTEENKKYCTGTYINAIFFALFLLVVSASIWIEVPHQKVTHYCKAGYVFLDDDTWHSQHDKQLIGENGGGVPCENVDK